MNWASEKRNIAELTPAEYNPRQLTVDQAKQLNTSLESFNLADPIIINKDNKIIGGHQRINILKQRGVSEVDVRVPDRQLTDDEEKELNLRLNKNLGEWDYDLLANFDEDLLLNVGFDSKELDRIFQLEPEEKDDDIPEDVPATTKLGDIYLLGNHRVMCGDSTKVEDVEKLMDGKKADMVFTDPPYGMDLDTDYSKLKGTIKSPNAKGYKWDKVIGDDSVFNFKAFEWLDTKEQFWWGADYYFNQLPTGGGLFVWQKRDKADEKMIGNDFELCWSKQKHKKATFWKRWVGFDSVEKGEKRKHPTQKPVELCVWFIDKFSIYKSIILDLFLGSGSTLIACEKTNRICYGMELDPKYTDVIVKRWEDYTGQKATKSS